MRSGLLDGLRAIDLSTPQAYDCGRILASYGVEVLRIDTSPAANRWNADSPDAIAWRIGNADKHCMLIDYHQPAGMAELRALFTGADIVIESFDIDELQRLGLTYETLRSGNPGLILVSVSPFGRVGPYAGYRGGELVVSAMSGILSTCGDADRAPVREPCDANFFHACAAGALGAVIAAHHRQHSGSGQWVDISAQEMGASRNTTWILAHQFDARAVQRSGANFGASRGIWKVKDGYVAFALMGGKFGGPANKALSDWMDELGYDNPIREIDWDRFMVQDVTDEMRARWISKLDAFFADRTRDEIATEGRRRGMTATPLAEPGETLTDVQLQARGYFGSSRSLAGRSVRLPEYFVRTSCDVDTPLRIPERPGVDGAAPIDRRLSAATRSAVATAPALPLAGIKLLDFSWAIVGGTTAKLLGDFGAEVIKIESRRRLGLERLANTSRVSKPGNLDDKPWFAHVNTSKKSFCLNLADPGSRPLIEKLVSWADVVLENFSPGTMDKLGLGYEAMRAIKPSIIMASGSVFGQTGPQRHFWGVDSTGAAASSRMFMTGWPDRGPVLPSAPYGDCLLPYLLATGMVAAVDYRDRTGNGCRIDGSMFEVLVQQMLPEVVSQQISAQPARRRGNAHQKSAPHGVFPCQGVERWIAIEIHTDEQWRLLRKALGDPVELADALFASGAARKQHEVALDAAVAGCTRAVDAYALMARLQAAGISAGVVQFAADTIERDPQLRSREFLQLVDHPLLAAFPHQASPIRLSATPLRMRPAPRFGEHTREICRDILRLDDTAISALEQSLVLS